MKATKPQWGHTTELVTLEGALMCVATHGKGLQANLVASSKNDQWHQKQLIVG
uniref:Uncharacterized protein n=1 Tax=Arundo donax TaxID=35708 RepID=A0A0A9B242_ARUDO